MRYYRKFILDTLRLMNSTSRNLEQEVDAMINIEKSLAKVGTFRLKTVHILGAHLI